MSDILHQPHDKLVSRLLSDKKVAIDLLRHHLPAHVVAQLQLSTLTLTSETAVNEKWKKFHNDMVFRCQTKNKKDTYIYMIIEHQSTPDPFMPVRLLCYKVSVLGKYLAKKVKPKKLPNLISLVLYHGAKEYPYPKDLFSCFENEELARRDFMEPMILLNLAETPDKTIIQQGGADALLKLMLKWGRKDDFINKLQQIMDENPKLFLPLSLQQAGYIYEYALHVGQGKEKNAEIMKAAIQKVYGEKKTRKFFSLADLYTKKGMEKGIKKGIKTGMKMTIQKLLAQGFLTEAQAKKALADDAFA